MRWLELSIEAPGEFAEPLAHLFSRHGEGAVAVEQPGGWNPDEGEGPPPGGPVIVRGYLPIDATTGSRKAMIEVGLRLISYLHELPPMTERVVDEEEWANQRFAPVRIGRNLVITPQDGSAVFGPRDLVIPLEPGLAFGTGHHPTTAMCLAALEDTVRPGARFLDVGCGSGILTIAALLLGAESAVCCDVEADSVKSTTANLEKAGLGGRARVLHGSIPAIEAPPGSFDIVAANISANVLVLLAGPLIGALRPDGVLLASGVLEERRTEVADAFAGAGGVIDAVATTGDWLMFTAHRNEK